MKMRIATGHVSFLFALAALLFIGFVQARKADKPHDLLIRNATLMDPGGTVPCFCIMDSCDARRT